MLLKMPKAPSLLSLRATVNINYCLPDVTYYFGNVILLYLNEVICNSLYHSSVSLSPFKKEIHEITHVFLYDKFIYFNQSMLHFNFLIVYPLSIYQIE